MNNLGKVKLLFDNEQNSETGIFNLNDSIESYKFINIIYSFGYKGKLLDAAKTCIFNVEFLKKHYGAGIFLDIVTINESKAIVVEFLKIIFIDKQHFNLIENKANSGVTTSNNKIYQIYAWN